MTTNERADLVSLIQRRYESLEHPNFSFVKQVVEKRPYRPLVDQLHQVVTVDETTDLNDDVSFVYTLRHGGSEWCLMLSTLGPYAVLLRPEGKVYRVSEGGSHVTGLEERLHELLAQHGVRVLSRRIMETPIDLRLYNTQPGRVRIFQALFTDTDFLPWDEASASEGLAGSA